MQHSDREAQREDVDDVLKSLGLAEEGAPPRIEAWNKIDLLSGEDRQRLLEEAGGATMSCRSRPSPVKGLMSCASAWRRS